MEHTYEEAARLCGVTVETIRQRARRNKLQRGRPTNTGRPTVLLTEQDIAAIAAGRSTSVQPSGQPSGQPDALAVLTGQLEHERRRADQAAERANRSEALASQRGVELADARVRAARAEGEAAALREALAEARRPAWRRWLGLN